MRQVARSARIHENYLGNVENGRRDVSRGRRYPRWYMDAEKSISSGTGNVISTHENVLVTVWRGPGSIEQIRRVRAVCEQLAARYPKGFAALAVLAVAGRPGSDEESAELKRIEADFGRLKLCDAYVIQKKGLVGAATRAAITGLNLMIRRSTPVRVFYAIEPASEWVASICGVDPEKLTKVVEKL